MSCDPPLALLDVFLDRLSKTDSDADVVFIPGDTVAHGVDLSIKDPALGNYELLKKSISTVINRIIDKFPRALIIPTFGNNDSKYHY